LNEGSKLKFKGGVKNMYHVYKFIDAEDKVLYIGKSKHVKSRISNHINEKRWIKEGVKVYVGECKNKTDMDMYEIYYINKYNPIHNVASMNDEEFSIKLPELKFVLYKEITKNDIGIRRLPSSKQSNEINSDTYDKEYGYVRMEHPLIHNGLHGYVLNKEINKLLYKYFYNVDYIKGYSFIFDDCGMPVITFDFLFSNNEHCFISVECEWEQFYFMNENFYKKTLNNILYDNYMDENRNEREIVLLGVSSTQ